MLSDTHPAPNFLRALGGSGASSSDAAPKESETYKELAELLNTLRKKKQQVSRVEDTMGTAKAQLAKNASAAKEAERLQKTQNNAREQLDVLREFLTSASKAGGSSPQPC